jgi:hypothetical protein
MSTFEHATLTTITEYEHAKKDALTGSQLQTNGLYMVSLPLAPPRQAQAVKFPVLIENITPVTEGHDIYVASLDNDLKVIAYFSGRVVMDVLSTKGHQLTIDTNMGQLKTEDTGYLKGYNEGADDELAAMFEMAMQVSGASHVRGRY